MVNQRNDMAYLPIIITGHFKNSWRGRLREAVPRKIESIIAKAILRGRARVHSDPGLNILVELVPKNRDHDSVFVAGKFESGRFIALTVLRREDACAMGWSRCGGLTATLGEIGECCG